MQAIENGRTQDEHRLDECEKAFWADPDELGELCKEFAIKNGLYADD